MLDAADRERIAAAIREAEARTAGEIVVVVARQAGSYRSVPLLYALVGALAAPWPLIRLTDLSAAGIFIVQLAVALAVAAAFSWPGRRPALVPRSIRRARAHEAAAREFLARGLTRTRERTGVLIFVALAERYAEVIADAGIAGRVDPAVWRDTVAELIEALRAGRAGDGLMSAVRRVGAILAEHAPPPADDADELPNKVIVI
ncbi:MAG TPA: TPM domain-containing protein [Beijerinckiaceae bacterium]|jgi:putative membrane protein